MTTTFHVNIPSKISMNSTWDCSIFERTQYDHIGNKNINRKIQSLDNITYIECKRWVKIIENTDTEYRIDQK